MEQRTRTEPKTVAAAERQMQAWVLSQQTAEGSLRVDPPEKPCGQLGEYIAISREAGARGSQIAELVGQKLNWEVLDKKLLDQVAEQSKLSRTLLDSVDETVAHWATNILGTWLDSRSVPHQKYVVHLRRIVLEAARRGNVVLVGRGAQFLLPREQGLAVRLIAPEKYRAEQFIGRHGFSAAKAKQFIAAVDRGRREFVARFFHRDINDPHLYDLVINVERFGPVAAAEQIVEVYLWCQRSRGG